MVISRFLWFLAQSHQREPFEGNKWRRTIGRHKIFIRNKSFISVYRETTHSSQSNTKMSISTEKQLRIEKSQSKIKIKICTDSWSLYYVTHENKVDRCSILQI